MNLRLYRDDVLVGELFTSEDGIGFIYDQAYRLAGGYPISVSMPLRQDAYPQKTALPFFEGLLPEGEQRRELSNILHLASASTIKLLAALAGECVGNLIILDDEMDIAEVQADSAYTPLKSGQLEALLKPQSVERTRFLAAKRLSLAGAQAKLGLYWEAGEWFATQGLAPTTHIIKPASQFDPTVLANELYLMRLSARCGIRVPKTWIVRSGEYRGLAVERFDRVREAGRVVRLAQEDFCQALAIIPGAKYENDGGPGLSELFSVILKNAQPPLPSLTRLLELVLFNYLVGNCDAHAKNFSLLRDHATGQLALALAYDLVCTTFYGERLFSSMAMRIGRHSQIDKINAEDFALFAEEVGLEYAAVAKTLNRLKDQIACVAGQMIAEVSDEIPEMKHTVVQLSEHIQRGLEKRVVLKLG
jgi:serine/threonine-protein kinase HipA